ncbi:MAG: hypothetical protein WD737_12340 [Gemmatimonadota bacterium]
MSSGNVELRSGRWDWRLQEQSRGALVVFTHCRRPQDEMRTWVESPEIMMFDADENARDPVSRTWDDGFGTRWRLSMSAPPAQASQESEEPLWLIFESGYRIERVDVPGSTHLGELTPGELSRLLAAAD